MKDEVAFASRQSIYVRLTRLDRLLDRVLGPGASDEERATFLGVGPLTFWRLRNLRGHKPSKEFIAAVLGAPWPWKRRPSFDDMFELRATEEVAA